MLMSDNFTRDFRRMDLLFFCRGRNGEGKKYNKDGMLEHRCEIVSRPSLNEILYSSFELYRKGS